MTLVYIYKTSLSLNFQINRLVFYYPPLKKGKPIS